MLEEPPVFDSQNGLNQIFGNIFVAHQPPLGALFGFEQRGDQLRLQLVGAQLAAVGGGIDASDLSAFAGDDRAFGAVIRVRPGLHLDPVAHDLVSPDVVLIGHIFRVAGAMQRGDDGASIHGIAGMKLPRLSVNLGRIGEDLPSHAPVHHLLVLAVVEGEDAQANEANAEKAQQHITRRRLAQSSAPVATPASRRRCSKRASCGW